MKHRMIGRVSLAAVLLAGLPWSAYAKVLKLDTPSTSMVLDAEKGKKSEISLLRRPYLRL